MLVILCRWMSHSVRRCFVASNSVAYIKITDGRYTFMILFIILSSSYFILLFIKILNFIHNSCNISIHLLYIRNCVNFGKGRVEIVFSNNLNLYRTIFNNLFYYIKFRTNDWLKQENKTSVLLRLYKWY